MHGYSTNHELRLELLQYYEVLETLLSELRELGEYRTHFGFLEHIPSRDYCYFKTILQPKQHKLDVEAHRGAMDKLQGALFSTFTIDHKCVLDVGCGTGGSMKHLAIHWPKATFTGININEVQINLARSHCADCKNVELINNDFLSYKFGTTFDLIYFVESAFHISDKELMAKRIGELLNVGGDLYVVDIFYPKSLAKLQSKNNSRRAIFDYLTLETWKTLLEAWNIRLMSYACYSPMIANHIQVKTPYAWLEENVLATRLRGNPLREMFSRRFREIYVGYTLLQKYLSRGKLEYSIAKFKRTG